MDSRKLSNFGSIPKALSKFFELIDRKKKPPGIYFHGQVGCGKTHLADAIKNELGDRKVFCVVSDMTHLIELFKNDELKMKDLKDPDVFILDGVGSEPRTEKLPTNVLNLVIHSRLTAKKPLIIMSRVNPKLISTTYSENVLLMIDEVCVPVKLDWENYRKKIAAKNKKLLS